MFKDVFPREWFNNYEKLKAIFYNSYNYPEFDTLRDEICKCIICDLNVAAITLTNHLIEDFLKKMLIYKNADKTSDSIIDAFEDSTKDYDNITLYSSIETAFKENIITESQKTLLHKFRNEFRNPYSHAESKKIFEGLKMGVQQVSLEDNELRSSEYRLEEIIKLPFAHGLVKIKIAKEIAADYLGLVDKIIREVLMKRKTSP